MNSTSSTNTTVCTFNHGEDPHIPIKQISRLLWGTYILEDDIAATVEDGWITLEGDVPCSLRKSQLPHSTLRNINT